MAVNVYSDASSGLQRVTESHDLLLAASSSCPGQKHNKEAKLDLRH